MSKIQETLRQNNSNTPNYKQSTKVPQQFSNRLPYKPTSPLSFKLGTSLSFAASILPPQNHPHPAKPTLQRELVSTALAIAGEGRDAFSTVGGKIDISFFERTFVF